jgi:hypothetical protein
LYDQLQRRSEMLANFLSRNAIDAAEIFSDDWELEQDEFCQLIKNHMHTHKNNSSCKHLDIADSCFTDGGILRRRITIIITPKSMQSRNHFKDS